MNEKLNGSHPGGMKLEDILYVIFRHKWKILLISVGGIIAAFLLPIVRPVPFESEARLYIRYVLETRAPSQLSENDTRFKSPEGPGNNIINTELQILTSRDLAQQVATAIGPERLLGKGKGNSLEEAARIVQAGVAAEVPKDSSVIRLVFQHRDPEVVQPVLNQLITFYFKKHGEIHLLGAFDDFLTQETDQLRSRLVQTEEELRNAKAKAGVISLEDTKSAYSQEISRIQQELLDAEAELAERHTAAKEMAKFMGRTTAGSTNEITLTNYAPVPSEKVDEYGRVCTLLDSLRRKEQELLLTFTKSNTMVMVVMGQIAANEQRKKQLEKENPGLLSSKGTETNLPAVDQNAGPRPDLVSEMALASALEAKVKVLTGQLDDIRKRAAAVAEAEGSITELQRRKELEESHYRKFSENLAQSQLDEKLGAGKVSNISMIEAPTPPQKAESKLFKMMIGVLAGSIGGAFGLAFLIELYLDQTIRRPTEIEGKLGFPLFMSIPWLPKNGGPKSLNGGRRALLEDKTGTGREGDAGELIAPGGLDVSLSQPGHPLRSYYHALRERLITYFEMKGMTHKPKLVAVTGCAEGSGVSTTAAGLAASLSETGEGNVLLVNMNQQDGAAHRFHHGELDLGLESILGAEKRDSALVQENLYAVNEDTSGENLLPILPKRFKQLVPRLKASDFDYIIFDMPPVSQISITPRLARFMDAVLMVVESEKTNREVVQKASALLAESNANIGVVLNKGRKYVPAWLGHEV